MYFSDFTFKGNTMLADFKNSSWKWARTGLVDGKQSKTASYMRWKAMCGRCEDGGTTQKARPSYVGCTMSQMFSDFHLFTDWHVKQVGYGVEGYQLDKDILIEGNKLYSETTCALVPRQLNMFLVDSEAARGEFPQGVCWFKRDQKFRAQLRINGNNIHLGDFLTAEEAFACYKTAKESEARRWHSRLVAGEFVVDERVIERMSNWVLVA